MQRGDRIGGRRNAFADERPVEFHQWLGILRVDPVGSDEEASCLVEQGMALGSRSFLRSIRDRAAFEHHRVGIAGIDAQRPIGRRLGCASLICVEFRLGKRLFDEGVALELCFDRLDFGCQALSLVL